MGPDKVRIVGYPEAIRMSGKSPMGECARPDVRKSGPVLENGLLRDPGHACRRVQPHPGCTSDQVEVITPDASLPADPWKQLPSWWDNVLYFSTQNQNVVALEPETDRNMAVQRQIERQGESRIS